MSPLPAHFTDRWRDRTGEPSFEDAVCWHVLLGEQAAVREVAADARHRLAGFGGLHWTPMRWLHMTVLLAGPAADIGQDARQEMVATARSRLAATAPVTVTLSRVFYHPEAIVLGVSPASALSPVFDAAQAATRDVTGSSGDTSAWTPHLTLCYSTSGQPAAPIIAALGKSLPPCEVTIDTLSLVVQNGPELLWDWQRVGDARLLGAHRHSQPLWPGEGKAHLRERHVWDSALGEGNRKIDRHLQSRNKFARPFRTGCPASTTLPSRPGSGPHRYTTPRPRTSNVTLSVASQ